MLVSGVGMVATATWCSHALARERYDLALNLGVCGSFDRTLPLGTVVHVVTDRLAELGAEDGERVSDRFSSCSCLATTSRRSSTADW